MLPILELNVYIPFSPRALIADRNTASPVSGLDFIVRDKRPVRVRFLKDGPQGTPELVDLGETANIALAGRAGDGMGESDSLIYLLNDFERVEVQDGESNITDIYYEGILDTNTTEAIEAVGEEDEIPTWTEIEISNADFSRRATVLRINSILKLDVYRGTEGAPSPADPLFLNQQQIEGLLTSGELDLVLNSLTVGSPSILALDEAEAELDDNDVLHVPTPGRGNILLVRRAESPAGGDEIDSFTGLVPGTIYYLVHDDAGGPIDFGDYEITDDGRPLAIRAISETEAVPFVTEPKA